MGFGERGEDVTICRMQPFATKIDVDARPKRNRMGSAALPIPGLDDETRSTGPGKSRGCGQACRAGADHKDIHDGRKRRVHAAEISIAERTPKQTALYLLSAGINVKLD